MSYNLPNQIIDASGNKIGIGTTAPEYRLDVRSSGAHSQVFAVQGAQGRLLSVDDNLSSGTLFSVSNITGLSSFEVNASGDVNLAEFGNSITAHKPILISGGVPVSTTNKLYNNNGTLSWNGSQVSTSAGAGSPSGIAFFDASGNLSSTPDLTIGSGTTGEGLNLGRPLYIDSPSASFLSVLRYNGSEKFRFNYNQFYPNAAGAGTSLGKSDAYWGHFFSRNAYLKGHTAAHVALTINGNSAQSANLTEWQDVNGVTRASIDPSGTIRSVVRYDDASNYSRISMGVYGQNSHYVAIQSDGAGSFSSTPILVKAGPSLLFQFSSSNGNVSYTHLYPHYNKHDLGKLSKRWDLFAGDVNVSGTTTFLQDDGSATDIFYSGNSLVMELPNKNFEIRGKDGNQFINFGDASNNAVNVGASLYPTGNKQKSLGASTLRWREIYGGSTDLEAHNNGTPTLILRKIAGQTADLTQWQDPSSNVLAYVDKDGHAHFPSLSVSGDFTYVNSENVTIFDKQIELASLSGSAVSGDALVDEGGFVLKSTDGDKQFIWRDQEDAWTSNQNITLNDKNLYIYNSGINTNSYERLSIGISGGDFLFNSYNSDQTLSGPYAPSLGLQTSQNIFLDAGYSHVVNFRFGGNNRGSISRSLVALNLDYQTHNTYPKTDSTYDLGTDLLYWNRVYARTLEARAAVGQTDNLTEWQDSAGDVLSKVTSDGSVHVSGVIASESDGEIRSYILGKPGDADTEYLRIGDLAGVVHSIIPEKTGNGQDRHIRIDSADRRGVLNLYSDGHLNYHFQNTHTFSAFHWGIGVSGEIRSIGGDDNRASLGQSTRPFSAGYLDEVYSSGVRTSGIYINDNVPASTANQLYNDAGTLKWNGSSVSTSTITGSPSGVAFFGDDASLTNVDKLVYASGDDGDNLEHGYHLYKTGAGTANWERAEIGWGRTGGNAPGLFYIGLNEGGTGSNSHDMRMAARQIDFRVGTGKSNSSLKLGTSAITTHMRVVPAVSNSTGDTLGHTTVPYGRLFLGDLDGSLRFNNDTYIGRPASGVLVVTSGNAYDNAVFRAGRFEAEGAHTDVTPLEVKGAISQTANLTEWKDGVGDTLASVDSAANLYVSGQLQYGTHGQKIYSLSNSETRFSTTYSHFRSGSHGVVINTYSTGGVALSPNQRFGWKSSATIVQDPTIYFKQYNFDSVAVETSAGLATLIASGVNTSGVYLADHVPVDRTDTIYNSGGTMTWDGAFAAETKSFLIDHPTREGMKLQYACLEGPENGAYVRGTTTTEIIELPDYWTGLVDEESITVQLTPKSHSQNTYVSGIMNNRVYLISDTDIDVYYNVYGTRKDVAPLEVEW